MAGRARSGSSPSLLIGNTLVNIGAGALAGEVARELASSNGWPAATAAGHGHRLTTVVILFLGEIVPKTLAKRHPVRVALAVIPLVRAAAWSCWPVSPPASWRYPRPGAPRRAARAPPRPAVTSEEIEYLIEMGTREGVLDEVKEELLNSVLEFADRVVKEIMVPRTRMVALDRDAPPEEIVRVVTENPLQPHAGLPRARSTTSSGSCWCASIVLELARGPGGPIGPRAAPQAAPSSCPSR